MTETSVTQSAAQAHSSVTFRISAEFQVTLEDRLVYTVTDLYHKTGSKKYSLNDDLSNVHLITQNSQFGVHDSILKSFPKIYKLLLPDDNTEELEIENPVFDDPISVRKVFMVEGKTYTSDSSLKQILLYLYTGVLTIDKDSAPDLAKTVELFNFHELDFVIQSFYIHYSIFIDSHTNNNISAPQLYHYLGNNLSVFINNLNFLKPISADFTQHLVKLLDTGYFIDVNEEDLFKLIFHSIYFDQMQKKKVLQRVRTYLIDDVSLRDLFISWFGIDEFVLRYYENQTVRGSVRSVCVFSATDSVLEILSVSVDPTEEASKDLAFITDIDLPNNWTLKSAHGIQVSLDSYVFAGGFSKTYNSINTVFLFHPFQLTPLPHLELPRVSASITNVISTALPLTPKPKEANNSNDTTVPKDQSQEFAGFNVEDLDKSKFKVIVSGGTQHSFESDTEGEVVMDSVEIFEDGIWSELCVLPRGIHSHASVAVDNDLYFTGGISSKSFDPIPMPYLFKFDMQQTKTHWNQLGSMANPRFNHHMCYHAGKLWVFGGNTMGPDGLETVPCTTIESYSLHDDTNQWVLRSTELPFGCVRLQAFGQYDNYFYTVGITVFELKFYLIRFDLYRAAWDTEFVVEVSKNASHIAVLPVAIRPY